MRGIKSVVYKCKRGGARPEIYYGGGQSLQGSRLVSCTCTSLEGWTGCWFGSEALANAKEREHRGTQVAGGSEHEYLWTESR